MRNPLFDPLQLGPYTLAHRVVMAPLTRMRAVLATNAPRPLNADYYAQRASPGGFIIAEASQITPGGRGAPGTPGIHSAEQIAGWKAITDAVHAKGGVIFLQLWHMGRLSLRSYQPDGGLPVAASAVKPAGKAIGPDFKPVDFETPRALRTDEIPDLVELYAQAARNAKEAGFDGVEIHGANGYLLEQFLQSRTNQRDDIYGGSIENRARFLLDVTRAVVAVWGAARVGVRLSPYGVANDSGEADPGPLYTYVIKELAKIGCVYLHLIEPRASGAGQREVDHKDVPSASALYRPIWPNVLIAAGNYKPDTAAEAVAEGDADAIAFGRYFISNPDLPERVRKGVPFTPYNRATFYGGDVEGYTDYQPHGAEGAIASAAS